MLPTLPSKMRKRRRDQDSDRTTEAAPAYKTVFINTNIDTHLALITSDSDTLSDLKDEIVLEHRRLFPEIGEIKIHSLKVKRKGFFYHLPDYMLLKTAFEGFNKSWFLDVDVSKSNDMLQIVKHAAPNLRDLLTTNSLLTTSASKDNNKSPEALHGNGNTTDNKQNNKANKVFGSHVESEPQKDDQETSSSLVKKSKQNRKGSQYRHEQAPGSLSLEKCGEDNECIKQNAEFEKRCASSGKDHDPDVNRTGELNHSQQGLEKPVESTLPSASSDTKEVNAHAKRNKRAKSSKSKFLDDQVDQVKNSTAVSHLVSSNTIDQELPESGESEKGRLISGKHQVPAVEHLGSSGIPHSQHDDILKDNNTRKTEGRTLSAIHDPEIRGNEELDPMNCISTAPSVLLVTKEVKKHDNSRKKRSKISRSGVQDEQVDGSKGSTTNFPAEVQQNRVSVVAENDSNMEQVPENNISSNSECPDVLKAFEVNESTNVGEKEQNAPSELLVTKGLKTHDNSRKKRSKSSRSGVQDEQVDRSKSSTADFPAEVQQNRESIVAENDSNMEQVPENNLSTNSECADGLKAFEVNESTNLGEKKQNAPSALLVAKEVKTHDNSRKKRSKTSRSGVQDEQVDRSKVSTADFAAKVQQNRESTVVENDSNTEQVPENNLSSNSECPEVLEAFEVNESNNVGEKKQNMEKAVEGVQETVAMDRDADQINDIVSPSLDSPEPGDLARPSENDQISQKVEERDLLVNNNNFEEILSRDRPSDNDQNEPMIETVSITNTSSATVAEEQKMGDSRKKKRAKKTVPVVCKDVMDTESTETHTRPSSSEPSRHTDMQVEKDKDLLLVSKRIEASARKSSDASGGKDTPPVESPLNQVSAELGSRKDGEVSECIGKETNVQQHFDSGHHHDEVFREPSVGTIAKNNIVEDIVPSVVSALKLQQDLPKSSQKDSIVSSADQVNNLTESKRVKTPKKIIGKRAVPYAAASSDLDEIRTPHKKPGSDKSSQKDSIVSSADQVNNLTESKGVKTPNKKIGKRTVPYAAASSDLDEIRTPHKKLGSDASKTVPSIKKNVKSLAVPGVNSSPKTNEKRVLQDRKESSLKHHARSGKNPSSKLNGQVVNKSKQKKSFGTPPKAIFRDASSESSLDENGSVDSSGSTRTPSDYSSSSSSDLSWDSKRKGPGDKGKGGSKKRILDSDPMQIPLDTILKSSSRFKKAKLTASQQLEDPDSQLDFPE